MTPKAWRYALLLVAPVWLAVGVVIAIAVAVSR